MGTANSAADLKIESKGDIVILRISGRLDAVSSPEVEKKIFDMINQGYHNLLADLATVPYLSSAGMRMLLSTSKRLRSLSGKLAVCNPMPSVLDVLKMSGFDHVLDLYKTEEEALRHF